MSADYIFLIFFLGGPMSEADWFGGRLRELREAAGWTQVQLAERAGLTREGVAQLEVGRRNPAWETVLALCKALGVNCLAFLEAPADPAKRAPGRPPKAPEAPPAEPEPKRPRGRPRKEK
jgi:transcriptional regulator with XRE-family HTH domain